MRRARSRSKRKTWCKKHIFLLMVSVSRVSPDLNPSISIHPLVPVELHIDNSKTKTNPAHVCVRGFLEDVQSEWRWTKWVIDFVLVACRVWSEVKRLSLEIGSPKRKQERDVSPNRRLWFALAGISSLGWLKPDRAARRKKVCLDSVKSLSMWLQR